MRAKGTSLTTAAIWATNCLVSFLVPALLESITYGTYLIFGSFCFIMAMLTLLFYPETKGKSLEEMDMIFGHSVLVISTAAKKKNPERMHVSDILNVYHPDAPRITYF